MVFRGPRPPALRSDPNGIGLRIPDISRLDAQMGAKAPIWLDVRTIVSVTPRFGNLNHWPHLSARERKAITPEQKPKLKPKTPELKPKTPERKPKPEAPELKPKLI